MKLIPAEWSEHVAGGSLQNSYQIKEADWKLFREFHTQALERLCERVFADLEPIISQEGESWYQRYLAVFKIITERDGQIAAIFSDFRRSTALTQLKLMWDCGLLTEEEIGKFSSDTQNWIKR